MMTRHRHRTPSVERTCQPTPAGRLALDRNLQAQHVDGVPLAVTSERTWAIAPRTSPDLASPAFERVALSSVTADGRRAPAPRFGDPRGMALVGALGSPSMPSPASPTGTFVPRWPECSAPTTTPPTRWAMTSAGSGSTESSNAYREQPLRPDPRRAASRDLLHLLAGPAGQAVARC